MKLLLNLIILIIIKLSYSQDTNSECTSYINSKSTYTQLPCGSSLEEACSTITLAAQSCNIQQFNSTIYNISPGYYSFNGIDAFGTIKNKNITIINSNYSINSTTFYTSVIFDLEGSTNTLFNINSDDTIHTQSIINVTGITFINGYQENKSSISVNYGTSSKLLFTLCIFDNVSSKATFDSNGNPTTLGGAFSSFENKNIIYMTSTVTFTLCTIQNTNTTGILGSFFYASNDANVILSIISCSFTNLTGNGQGVVIYSNSNSNLGQVYQMIDTLINDNQFGGSAIQLSSSIIIKNIIFANNSGDGIGLHLIGRASYYFSDSTFTNNTNIASIYVEQCPVGLEFLGCDFTFNVYNKDSIRSGVLTLSSSAASIQNSIFENNYASNGAAIYAFANPSDPGYAKKVSLLNTTISNNIASSNGSIYSSNVQLSLANLIFDNNQASLGSSIYCDHSTIFFVYDDNEFGNNTDTTITNQNDTYGIVCGSNGVNTCSIQGNFSNMTVCGVDGNNNNNNNNSNDHKYTNYKALAIGLGVSAFIIVSIIIIIVVVVKNKRKHRYTPIY